MSHFRVLLQVNVSRRTPDAFLIFVFYTDVLISSLIMAVVNSEQSDAGDHKAPMTMHKWTDAKAWETQDTNNTNDPQKKYGLGTVSKDILLEGLKLVSRRQPPP